MTDSGHDWVGRFADDLARIATGRHHDPHAILGPHRRDAALEVLVYRPGAARVRLEGRHEMRRLGAGDAWHWRGAPADLPGHPLVGWLDGQGTWHEQVDPYSFQPSIGADDLHLLGEGTHVNLWRMLGALPHTLDGVVGTRFAVWAPNAERVSLVGPFCDWDGRCLPLRVLGTSGVWELFMPGLGPGELYKFELRARDGSVFLKSDPLAQAGELRPGTASRVTVNRYAWSDAGWLARRARHDWLHAPLSIYEVHPGSWRRHPDGRFYSYRELAEHLVPYVHEQGFTHIELLPITEHPLDDSWGYQTTGYFAPTSRFGAPDELRQFIDTCHGAGIGVLLDWVPGHFPRDAHGLARFDGTALYEYQDRRKAEHRDWGTLIFNYERHEVRAFLLSSACYWLEEFHFDGLRVDAVASMLFLDFGRQDDFVPNRHGGRENLEAIEFLRALNATTHARYPGTVVIAEESTDWPLVSRPTDAGGLGFSMKWNMGWMHDTLTYFGRDAVHRRFHQDQLTFAMMYAYSENFVLPLSHDEVVHLKRSLLGKMSGDRWQQFANLRLLLSYQWTFPGKKLLFMGGEFANPWEWDFRAELPWWLLQHAEHAGVQRLLRDLNRQYLAEPALHACEFEPGGFQWLDCSDREQSVLSYVRRAGADWLVVVLNFTPVPRERYRIGVPAPGHYRVILNSDSTWYGGSNTGSGLPLEATRGPLHGQACSLTLTLPPLGALVLRPG
ncbi:MAG: 1,4-alpha-glucan branching protein GlgB [Gammaproteobacteria bacterium]|nr:1,4-alpha-glucan branching protein GlgB [Gammaproteobacteria bacterium]